MPTTPLHDRITSLITWLADRLASHAGQAVGDHPVLDPTRRGLLLARLRQIAARFAAVLGTPIPPPKPAPKPPEPRFVPTHILTFHPEEPLPEPPPPPPTLPRTWRWLLRYAPFLIPGRDQMEEFLRDPEIQARLEADPRLGPLLRPLAWMLGVDRKLLPAATRRPRPAVVVCGGLASAAAAAAEYTATRAEVGPSFDIATLCYKRPWKHRHRRDIWRGKNGYALPDGVDLWG